MIELSQLRNIMIGNFIQSIIIIIILVPLIIIVSYRYKKDSIAFPLVIIFVIFGLLINFVSTITEYFRLLDPSSEAIVQIITTIVSVGVLALMIYYIVTKFFRPLEEITAKNEILAQGILNPNTYEYKKNNEIGRLFKSYNDINQFLIALSNSVNNVKQSLKQSSQELASTSEEMNSSSEEISTLTQNLSKSSQEQVFKVDLALKEASDLNNAFQSKINELKQTSKIIESITSQVNMLALNASIEAARAGEYGRGFSVVADNIRQLADSTKDSLSNVDRIITEFDHTLDLGIKKIKDNIESIAIIAQENASGSEEASATTEEHSAGMDSISSSSQELANLALVLEENLEIIKIKE